MSKPEIELAEFVAQFPAIEVPDAARKTARRVLMACAGTGVAAGGEAGIAELHDLLTRRGGAHQARSLIFGGWLPAHAAAQFNGGPQETVAHACALSLIAELLKNIGQQRSGQRAAVDHPFA